MHQEVLCIKRCCASRGKLSFTPLGDERQHIERASIIKKLPYPSGQVYGERRRRGVVYQEVLCTKRCCVSRGKSPFTPLGVERERASTIKKPPHPSLQVYKTRGTRQEVLCPKRSTRGQVTTWCKD